MQKRSKRNWLRLVPGLLISVASLLIVFYFVDLDRFIQAIRRADYGFVALLFGITLLWLVVRTLVWRTLLCEQATFSQVFLTLNEGYLLNNILPFRLGEAGRAFLLGKKTGLAFLQVFSTILIERLLDVVMAASLLLITLPYAVQIGLAWQVALLTGVLVIIGLVVLFLLARNRDWAVDRYEKAGARLPALNRFLKPRYLLGFLSGLQPLTDLGRFLKVIGWMLINWGVAIVQFYVLLRAFFPSSQPLWAAFTLSVMALGIATPSSPGAIGVMEASIVGALSVFGLDPSVSLAAALTAHLSNYLVSGVIGAYALARDGMSLSGLYQDVSRISPAQPDHLE